MKMEMVAVNGRNSYVVIKRFMDVLMSLGFILLFSPLFLVIGAIIALDDGMPVAYSQRRLGYRGVPFTIWKFRTMKRGAEKAEPSPKSQGSGVPEDFVFQPKNDPRITGSGRWLRKYSLDELPQFLNVLMGNMSLVGPRPEPMSVSQYYNDEQASRLLVKPGLTGLAQVYGRGELTMKKKLSMDLEYIRRCSITLDLLILLKTLPVVLKGKGAR